MLRSCCVTRYLRRSAEADLLGERPSLCAVPDTWENRVSGTTPRNLASTLRFGVEEGFFLRAPAETANGASSRFAQTIDPGLPSQNVAFPPTAFSVLMDWVCGTAGTGMIFYWRFVVEMAGASESSVCF